MPGQERAPERKRLSVSGVFDIEAYGWDQFLIGVTQTRSGDIEVHETPDSMVRYMLFMGGTWWGHNSGKYDSLQLLDVMHGMGKSQSVSLSGGRATRVMGAGLTLRDSYALIPMALDYAADMGGVLRPRLWLDCTCGRDCDGYCRLRKRMPPYMKQRVIDLCIQDCGALMSALVALDEFAERYDFDLTGTIGGSAWATARRLMGLPNAEFSASQWARIRSAYYGGRCSVFRPIIKERGHHYDIGSAYPHALATASLPCGEASELGARSALAAMATDTPGIYSCTMHVPDMRVPPLPWALGSGLSFPTGTIAGCWALPEIWYAESVGCEIRSVEWAMTWDSESRLFSDFIRRVYEVRSTYGKASPWGMWLRLFANSLCGKFAERPDKRYVRMNPDLPEIGICEARAPCTLSSCSGACGAWEQLDKWGTIWSVPFYRPSDAGHIHWAAYLTAASRMQHHASLAADESVAYCDTDSLWTTANASPEPAGSGIGEWARKCGFLDFEAVAPKCYAYTDEVTGEYIVCSAGATLSATEWRSGVANQDRGVMSLVDAARAGGALFRRAHRTWTLPKHGEWYGDRKLSSDGTTHPVTCPQLRTRLNERRAEQRAKRAAR
jgi:hypothetical protein